MAETLFAFDDTNFASCQSTFRGARRTEYYQGDYSIDSSLPIEVRAEKKAVGPYSIIRLRSRSRLSFRREWRHIRADSTNLTLIWFVKRGSLIFSNQTGRNIAQAGDMIITRSMTPFVIECQPDAEGFHEAFHVTIPTHFGRSYIPDDLQSGFTTSALSKGFRVAENILEEIFEDIDELAEHSTRILMDSALSVLSHTIKSQHVIPPKRESVCKRRYKDIIRYIEVHMSDPDLSVAKVAEGCDISPRYLALVLRANNACFSHLLWNERLKRAKVWLEAARPEEFSINEIAYNVGFKSAAHFSRRFKDAFNVNPRDFRSIVRAEGSAH